MKQNLILAALLIALTGVEAMAEVKLKGDVRLRHETIDQERKETRNRQRIRARVQMDAEVNDSMRATLGLASGGDDPVSTNQSFDGSGTSKGFQLNLAYLTWTLGDLEAVGGKMRNPFRKTSDLIWDGDLTLEGLGLHAGRDVATIDVGAFVVEERSSSDDTHMFGAQVAVTPEIEDGLDLTVGGSYFLYDNVKGFEALYDGDFFGNSSAAPEGAEDDKDVEPPELFVSDFGVLEWFVKVGLARAEFFADYVVNTESATSDDTGYQVGVRVKATSDLKLGYYWRRLEADAVFGTWADSDFGGGGTGSEGHKLTGEYKLASNVSAALAVLVNETGLDGDGTDYNRVQVDLKAKF